MKLVAPNYIVLTPIYGDELIEIENVARTCYKSEAMMRGMESAKKLVGSLISRGHEAMLEHSKLSVKFMTDRATTHELVRHRMASFAQESQRYCNYSKDKFNNEITFIRPWWLNGYPRSADILDNGYMEFVEALIKAEDTYFKLLDVGYDPQDARAVLPNCVKTEIVVTANYREWRHILKLRTANDAAPEMRRLMRPLLGELKAKIPVIFDDIDWESGTSGEDD